MSRYLPASPRTPTTILQSNPISLDQAHSHLQSYLLSTSSSQPWSHSHDAGTTASLKKLELSLRGIHGPAANSHFIAIADDVDIDTINANNVNNNNTNNLDLEDTFSKPDTDEGGESERQRVYETVEDLEVAEEIRDEDDGVLMRELQNVEKAEEGQEDVEVMMEEEEKELKGMTVVVDKEERKRLKKLRMKEEKKRKEAERAAERE
ncbi:hypothetical protein TWF106_005630 [Orbilia oligospora]|uniref:Uncharacterized protein n=1 Tax=Orbilia oligospora TaxID=2813651 RepID=A0A7C8QPU6_ORBOL|nr:hypothetical protein TWF106_005630 [Orbilia oligospora]